MEAGNFSTEWLDSSQDFPLDPEIRREACPQREPESDEGKTCGEQFEGERYPKQRKSIDHECYGCDDEAEFRPSH